MKAKKSVSKRILVLNYEFPPLGGGASPVAYELAKNFIKCGYKVDVVTMHFKGLQFFETKDGINIYRVNSFRKHKETCTPWEQGFFLIFAWFVCKKLVKENKYDICHTHFIIPTGVLSFFLKIRFRLEYFITLHGSDVPGYNPDRFKILHKFTKPILILVANHSKKIIFPSFYLQNLFSQNVSKEIVKNKGIIIKNGVDINKFKAFKKEKIIISVGRLLKRKGFHKLIKTISNFNSDWQLHIVGDGPMLKELKEIALKSKIKVVFHGWLNNNSLKFKKLIGRSSIFCLLSDSENSSMAVIEAMSAGNCIVVKKSSGLIEMVDKSGFLLDEEEYNLFFSKVFNNEINLTKYIDLSLEKSKQFDIFKISKKYLQTFYYN